MIYDIVILFWSGDKKVILEWRYVLYMVWWRSGMQWHHSGIPQWYVVVIKNGVLNAMVLKTIQ